MSTEKNPASIAIAGASLIPIEVAMNMFHGGLVGGALGLFVGGLVYIAVDEAQKNGREISLPLPDLQHQREPGELSFLYRLTHGKDSREIIDAEPDQEDQEQ